ncbi:MarR family winged helix-turn-helix transcriptional regulator [Bacillus sp. 1P06AnD]|uniref:MarR family winged helix-turn-helix transcriptional regulator n=1 Tax=Bacillus sp. 1P06AnD TaxID=3132208 RepID=UPI0039A05E8E
MNKPSEDMVQRLLVKFFEIQDKSAKFMSGLTADAHISKNLMLLIFLLRLYRQMKITEIADAFMLTPGAATNMCDKLEDLGFAERIRMKDDRRVVRMSLTKKGEQKVEAIFSKFTNEELEQLTATLGKISTLFGKL